MKETFRRELHVPRPPDELIKELLDPPRVASWVPILHDLVEEVPLQRYRGVLEDKLGPFRLRADLSIDVVVGEGSITMTADGRDRQIGSRLSVEGSLEASADEGGSLVVLAGVYEVSGKAAQLGASSVRRKAATIVDAFAANLVESAGG